IRCPGELPHDESDSDVRDRKEAAPKWSCDRASWCRRLHNGRRRACRNAHIRAANRRRTLLAALALPLAWQPTTADSELDLLTRAHLANLLGEFLPAAWIDQFAQLAKLYKVNRLVDINHANEIGRIEMPLVFGSILAPHQGKLQGQRHLD